MLLLSCYRALQPAVQSVAAADAGRYIYNHPSCGRCGSPVSTWTMAARKVYACETCQPLQEGTELPEARRKAMNESKPHKVSSVLFMCGSSSSSSCTARAPGSTVPRACIVLCPGRKLTLGRLQHAASNVTAHMSSSVQEFASHCAPEPSKGPAQQTAAQLREQLAAMGLATPKGARKPALVAQLEVQPHVVPFLPQAVVDIVPSGCCWCSAARSHDIARLPACQRAVASLAWSPSWQNSGCSAYRDCTPSMPMLPVVLSQQLWGWSPPRALATGRKCPVRNAGSTAEAFASSLLTVQRALTNPGPVSWQKD